ncbi:cell division protein FtsB [Aliidiomarina taiwanensis]|uniref:Cell division protein FtsB n=1 Tax=Aliidiomarina taiwanensis TaxID=946228 RepID=A0A432XA68_9GAMM|nr:cell division protein FtsB [Aliidiomarina taiwanensis]RUO44224.1 cell division protein FtsB [Aliidiomarina taiwanensis]
MRFLTLCMLCIFILLQYRIWFGQSGVSEYRELRSEIQRQSDSNAALKQRNQLIYADIRDLREARDAVEERARNELGMVKADETFFRLIAKDNNSS